jgi:hypothetical protein
MLDPHREIQALVDNFVAELGELAKRIAIEQVKVAFDVGAKLPAGVGVRPPGGVGRKPLAGVGRKPLAGVGRKPSAGAAAKPSAGATAKLAAPAPARKRRVRRGQREIEALRGNLLAAVAEQPGRRTEDLNAALGTRTTQIAPVLRRLVADNQVRTEGARRGTRYFAVVATDGQNGRRAAAPSSAAVAAAVVASAAAEAAAETAAAAEEPPA